MIHPLDLLILLPNLMDHCVVNTMNLLLKNHVLNHLNNVDQILQIMPKHQENMYLQMLILFIFHMDDLFQIFYILLRQYLNFYYLFKYFLNFNVFTLILIIYYNLLDIILLVIKIIIIKSDLICFILIITLLHLFIPYLFILFIIYYKIIYIMSPNHFFH